MTAQRIPLTSLIEALTTLGHAQLWFRSYCEPGLPDYFEVISADGRDLAWWCADSRSWFLNQEADDMAPFSSVPDLTDAWELDEASAFALMTLYNFC